MPVAPMQVSEASLVMLPWPPLVLKSCGFVAAPQNNSAISSSDQVLELASLEAERLRCLSSPDLSKANSTRRIIILTSRTGFLRYLETKERETVVSFSVMAL
jgi:hypothetical protein